MLFDRNRFFFQQKFYIPGYFFLSFVPEDSLREELRNKTKVKSPNWEVVQMEVSGFACIHFLYI